MKNAMKKICAVAAVMLILVCSALSVSASALSDGDLSASDAIIGEADGPTAILVAPAPVSDSNISASDVSASDLPGFLSFLSGSDFAEIIGRSPAERQANTSDSLVIMGQGMLGIFVVMVLIYLVVVILNVATNRKKDDSQE